LTAYLDGEIDDDRASAIRGHMRGCEACRAASSDEATLRDGLRQLPPIDPPASLWAGVQRELAAAEVADAERPRWRRVIAKWVPMAPRFGLAGAAIAIAIGVLVWKSGHRAPPVAVNPPIAECATPPCQEKTTPRPALPPTPEVVDDVSVALATAPAHATQGYVDAADELVKCALDDRAHWSDDRKQVFDDKLAKLRHDIDAAAEGRPRQKAYRVLIRYLQHVTNDNEVALADVRGAP
jgi:predicted anti-sigma-YlaC factor YlaD